METLQTNPRPKDLCKDCGKNTRIDDKDYYMINDVLWKIYGVGEGMLCMDCMEKRIGRKLIAMDLTMCPLNTHYNYYTKSILVRAGIISSLSET